jgi:peptidoglycan/xylan/chitin deacetylase (PgdA/CDA1 family)
MIKKYGAVVFIALLGSLFAGGVIWMQSSTGPPALVTREGPLPITEPRSVPPGVPVLMYHSIGAEQGNDAVISKEHFSEQMAFLYNNHFHPISLDELYLYLQGKGDLPVKPVVLTFDDGYRDTYDVVFPILRQYGFKSTLFIPASFVGPRLSWQELKEMKAAGMEIAAHSLTHRDLGQMTVEEQANEINKSKEILDKNLEQNTVYFAYPNGSYNQITLKLLEKQGYRFSFTINPGWVKPGDQPLSLNRVWVGNQVDIQHFQERITRMDYSIL